MYDISTVLDLTSEQTLPPGHPEKYKMRGSSPVVRDPKKITGIVVHQTACVFGVSHQQVKDAKGDVVLAKHRRALDVAAHITAFTTGRAVYANQLPWYVYHGNGLNAFTYGMEIEGLYPGLKGFPSTVSGDVADVTVLTKATIDAARTAITFLYERGRMLGSPLEYVYAHRQSSSTRRNDPGQEIWEQVVLAYAVPVLGLKTKNTLALKGSNAVSGDGAPIPKEWDPSATSRY